MKKAICVTAAVFCLGGLFQTVCGQTLEGTWVRTIFLETECPGVQTLSEEFTDTVTYLATDRAIELPQAYQMCDVEENGGAWSLDCSYDQEMDVCLYHFQLTGDGGLEENEFDFQFTAEYTVTGGVACGLIPLCVMTGTIHGDRVMATSVEDGQPQPAAGIPCSHALFQNSPNPFNPKTDISYQLSAVSNQTSFHTTLKIYNILGQEVATLVDEAQPTGNYTVTWDGTDGAGRVVSNGFYFCRLEVDGFTATRCMLLLK